MDRRRLYFCFESFEDIIPQLLKQLEIYNYMWYDKFKGNAKILLKNII